MCVHMCVGAYMYMHECMCDSLEEYPDYNIDIFTQAVEVET